MKLRSNALVAALIVAGALAPRNAAAAEDALTQKVNAAIAAGVRFLKAEQNGKTGLWTGPNNQALQGQARDFDVGATALAGLTLLECGVAADDPVVQKAAEAIRPHTVKMTFTYSLSLAIMFLDRLGDPVDVALIESMTVRLLAGQNRVGGWNYNCPAISEAEMRRLANHIKDRSELVAQSKLPKASGKRRTAKDLPKEIIAQLVQVAQGRVEDNGATGDNSNTQFAAVALWIARRHGLPADEALDRLASTGRAGQDRNGGWRYQRPALGASTIPMEMPNNRVTAAMTCSGLIQLAVGNGVFNEVILRKKGKGKPTGTRDPSKDSAIRKGLAVLAKCVEDPAAQEALDKMPKLRGEEYYFLWSLERTAMIYDLKRIGNKDWYTWGAQILLTNQNGDGGWRGKYATGGVDTSFALLFLCRSNLAADLTTSLKGNRRGSEISLKLGGVGGSKLVSEKDIEGGVNPKNKSERNDNKNLKVKPKAIDAGAGEQGADIARLSTELVQAPSDKQDDLLQGLEKGKGLKYTEALAASIPLLKGAIQDKARLALSQRMARMSVDTLRDKLLDDSLEIRRAAASACARKKAKSLTPNLIALLEDRELPVAEAAHTSLKALTDQDFGPEADATRPERKEAVSKWKSWWKKQQKE